MTGGEVSTTATFCTAVDVLLAPSFAIHVIQLVPGGYPAEGASLVTLGLGSRLSVTFGAVRGTMVRVPEASTTRSLRPLIVGGVLSLATEERKLPSFFMSENISITFLDSSFQAEGPMLP